MQKCVEVVACGLPRRHHHLSTRPPTVEVYKANAPILPHLHAHKQTHTISNERQPSQTQLHPHTTPTPPDSKKTIVCPVGFFAAVILSLSLRMVAALSRHDEPFGDGCAL